MSAGTPGVRRLPQSPRDRAFDIALTLLVLPTALPYMHREGIAPDLRTITLLLLVTLPLLVRRRWPLPVFGVVLAANVIAFVVEPRVVPGLALLVAMYTVAEAEPPRRTLMAAAVFEAFVVVVSIRRAGPDWWYAAIFITGMVTAAVGLGLYTATRRSYLEQLRERARQLEHERDQEGELAAAAERARIAHEMHDIVAHHLTVIVALSDGLAASPTASGRDAEVLRMVSATGRQALADTRRVLGVLRDDPQDGAEAGRRPVPDLAGIDAMLARVRAAGLPVAYEVSGAAVALPPAVQLTAYRIVQEALTNTLKYAGAGAAAVVRLRYGPGELRLDVEDDGPGTAVPAPVGGSSRGLVGMRERVQAYDGDFHAGPRPRGGWQVSALLRLPS